MAHSDPRICNVRDFCDLASYAKAFYDTRNLETSQILDKELSEVDMRSVSVSQTIEDFLDQDASLFKSRGVARIRVIPSESSPAVVDGYGMTSTELENSLLNLFGEQRDFDCITNFSMQRVAFQDEENGYKLPTGMMEVGSEQVLGRTNVAGFFDCLHTQGRFAPLTGRSGNVLKTYWETMQDNPNFFNIKPPLYAVDIRASPTHVSNWAWDFSDLGKDNPFTNILWPSLKREAGYQWFIPGVQAPFTYVAGSGSFFAFHEEDMNLFSMNVHLGGFPKVWYVIRPRSVVDFRAAVEDCIEQGYAPDSLHRKCPDPIRHRCFIFSPEWLSEWGIYHDVIVQRPNDIILTLGLGGHQGVNIGPCINEAINICGPKWLQYGKRATSCRCGYYEYPPVEINLLPYVAEWENQKTGRSFIRAQPEGNTVIKHVHEGYFPGEESRVTQRRHIKSMVKTGKNDYMFFMVRFVPKDDDEIDEDDGPNYDEYGRHLGLLEGAKDPKTASDLVDEEISSVFGIDEASMWAKSCKSLEEYRDAKKAARKKYLYHLKKTNRTSLFQIHRRHALQVVQDGIEFVRDEYVP